MHFMKNRLASGFALALFLMASCKKNDLQENLTPTPTPVASADALKDTALLYTKDIYLWYNQIPASFNAHSYSDYDALMTGIRQYSTETGFSTPVDRWSFAMEKSEWDNLSSG